MSQVSNKNVELEVQKRSNELRKLKTEERVMRSMLDEAQGQLTNYNMKHWKSNQEFVEL